MFTAVANPFGTDTFVAPASPEVRIIRIQEKAKRRRRQAPSLTRIATNFLLNYNG
jgi:hypothetical protein